METCVLLPPELSVVLRPPVSRLARPKRPKARADSPPGTVSSSRRPPARQSDVTSTTPGRMKDREIDSSPISFPGPEAQRSPGENSQGGGLSGRELHEGGRQRGSRSDNLLNENSSKSQESISVAGKYSATHTGGEKGNEFSPKSGNPGGKSGGKPGESGGTPPNQTASSTLLHHRPAFFLSPSPPSGANNSTSGNGCYVKSRQLSVGHIVTSSPKTPIAAGASSSLMSPVTEVKRHQFRKYNNGARPAHPLGESFISGDSTGHRGQNGGDGEGHESEEFPEEEEEEEISVDDIDDPETVVNDDAYSRLTAGGHILSRGSKSGQFIQGKSPPLLPLHKLKSKLDFFPPTIKSKIKAEFGKPDIVEMADDSRLGSGLEADLDVTSSEGHCDVDDVNMAEPEVGFGEMRATIWANVTLTPGTTFTPDQGQIRLETLEIYRKLRHDDVRYDYGLFDEIHIIDEEEVRHCNWVRFLRASHDLTKVNMVAVKVAGHVFFQVISSIPPNGELSVYFERRPQSPKPLLNTCSITDTVLRRERIAARRDSLSHSSPPEFPSNVEYPTQTAKESSPLNPRGPLHGVSPIQPRGLTEQEGTSPSQIGNPPTGMSPPTSNSKTTPSRSPESTRSLGAHSLMMTSPSDKEDDIRSTISDVTSGSEDSHHGLSAKSSFSSSFSSEARTPVTKPTSPSPSRSHVTPDSTSRLHDTPTTHPSPSGTFSSPNMASPLTSPSGSVTSPSGFPGRSPEEYLRLPVKRNRERTWLPCDVCGKKFDRPSLLRRHMRTHTGEKPHACDVCGKAFSTSSSLNTHRRIHSGEKPHQCPVCGKRFTASSNLYYHRMTHNKDKPHKCTLCSKSFPTPGDLKSHMYVHNGSWPYKCDVCNRGFSKHTNLKNHLLLHTGDKPHECELCGKRFALQCNLKTHMKTHEGEAQEECYKCGKVYLASSRQVFNGYCRSCLQGPSPVGHPAPHPHTPGPSPGPGGPSPGGGRPQSFSVESLATSSSQRSSNMGMRGDVPASGGGAGGAAALSMSGYAMFDPKPGMMSVGTIPGHRPPVSMGNPLITYSASLPWPKLVPQQY